MGRTSRWLGWEMSRNGDGLKREMGQSRHWLDRKIGRSRDSSNWEMVRERRCHLVQTPHLEC